MTSPHPVPPLPQPQQPAQAARTLAEAAHAAAGAWAQPLDPRHHDRAVSQLYSTVRDAGIAARGLAGWQLGSDRPGLEPGEFPRHVTAAAGWLLTAWNSLDGMLANESTGPLPDPDEPGAALCHAARNTLCAWRQPSGTAASRDATVRRLITATVFLSAGTLGLATYAPDHRAADLQAVSACLAEVTAHLAAAVQGIGNEPGTGPGPRQQEGSE